MLVELSCCHRSRIYFSNAGAYIVHTYVAILPGTMTDNTSIPFRVILTSRGYSSTILRDVLLAVFDYKYTTIVSIVYLPYHCTYLLRTVDGVHVKSPFPSAICNNCTSEMLVNIIPGILREYDNIFFLFIQRRHCSSDSLRLSLTFVFNSAHLLH